MKIIKAPKVYAPITITIESEEDYNLIYDAFNEAFQESQALSAKESRLQAILETLASENTK